MYRRTQSLLRKLLADFWHPLLCLADGKLFRAIQFFPWLLARTIYEEKYVETACSLPCLHANQNPTFSHSLHVPIKLQM